MTETVTLDAHTHHQIHEARKKDTSDGIEVVDLGPIKEVDFSDYNGLTVTDISDEYKFQAFDSGCRLVKTENGELLIVHHSVVPTGAWSIINNN